MRILPRTMAARIAVVLLAAVGGVFALDRVVEARERRAAIAAREEAARRNFVPEPVPPVRLPAVDGTVRLALSMGAVPAEAAPVVQILSNGEFAVRRPLPIASGPLPSRAFSPALVLPSHPRLLDPRTRATLTAVIGALVAERPVPSERFFTLDFALERRELERILGWVP